ncbi:MAG: hypothetical protein ABJA02_07425 [Acidobacteriota bacterium]
MRTSELENTFFQELLFGFFAETQNGQLVSDGPAANARYPISVNDQLRVFQSVC